LLEHTFIHLQGIGPKTEQGLWRKGLLTWQDLLGHPGTVLSADRDGSVRRELEASAMNRQDPAYFWKRLPPGETWRLFDAFRSKAVYLDIETTGGFHGGDAITVIGLYDGRQTRTFINGLNLEAFEEALAEFELLITFNGTSFDLPFIRRWFRGIRLPQAHIDLRFTLQRLGYRGGLKAIEKKVGLVRDADLEGLDGFDAVRLWEAYQWGDAAALDRLVRYNTLDIVHLQPLMELCSRRLKADLLKPYLPPL
jgi:uncharacterized protein YprB with RNaseH-like and TPR domain